MSPQCVDGLIVRLLILQRKIEIPDLERAVFTGSDQLARLCEMNGSYTVHVGLERASRFKLNYVLGREQTT